MNIIPDPCYAGKTRFSSPHIRESADIEFNAFKNILVGNNGVGKSTLMEALSLAMGYGLSKLEITPHLFHM